MTRRAIIEHIDFMLQRRFPKAHIEGVMDLVWEQFSDILLKQDDSFFFTRKYEDVAVTLDSVNGRYYSDIPTTVVRDGVVSVYAKASEDLDMVQVSEKDFRLMGLLESNTVNTQIMYYVNFNRIFFNNQMTSLIAAEGVSMDLIITLSSYDITEDIPIPKIGNISFIDAVINYLKGIPAIDLSNLNKER